MNLPTTWYVRLRRFLRRYWPRRPTGHVGATTQYADQLRAMRDVEVSPELVSDVERELAWGLLWHEFEHAMQTAIDDIFAPVLAELNRPRTFPELYELVFPEQVNERTGEYRLVTV